MAAAVLVAASAFLGSAQNVDRQIEAIRKAYADANAKVVAVKADPRTSSVYVNELRVNAGRTSWPAVGIYTSTIHFYYEIQGEGPYPNHLFKIDVRTERSARAETEEFLFDSSGKLIFYFGNDGETETRAYFAEGGPIRSLKGTAEQALQNQKTQSEIKGIRKRSDSLQLIFKNSTN